MSRGEEWHGALVEAARHLPVGLPDWLLFVEHREDLRAEVTSGGSPDVVRTRWSGLSLRTGPAPLEYRSLSDPTPERLEAIARGGAGAARIDAPERAEPPTLREQSALDGLEPLAASAARAAGAGGAARARYVAFAQEVWVLRAGGAPVRDVRRGRRLRVEVRISRGGASAWAVAEKVPREGEPEDVSAIARAAAERAQQRLEARPVPAGERPVVFAPGVGGILLHELVGHALEADRVRRGGTALVALPPPIAPPEVLVLDDPRRGRAAWRIDDEGEPARATPLVRGGRVGSLLVDLRTAREAGTAATGHGRRSSYREPVLPRMGCTFLAAGAFAPEEALEGVARGLYVRRMEVAATDPSRGETTFRVTDADEIERGALGTPTTPFLLEVTTRDALGSIERIADDLAFDRCVGNCVRDGQPIATSVGAPTFRIGLTKVVS